MENSFVTLRSYTDIFEAELVKELLEDNNFTVNLKNEYMVSNLPGVAGGDTMFLEVQVIKEELEDAKEFLEDISDSYLTERIFIEIGAKLDGHFLLTSGRHSNQYFEKIKVIQNPAKVAILCNMLAKRLADYNADIVIGPAYGAIVLGYEVAKQLNKPFAFSQRKDGEMSFRSGFDVKPGMKALIIEDVTTTGGSIFEVKKLLEDKGMECVAIGLLVDRSNGTIDFGTPVEALLTVDAVSWEAEECPLCKDGIPLTKPGRSDK